MRDLFIPVQVSKLSIYPILTQQQTNKHTHNYNWVLAFNQQGNYSIVTFHRQQHSYSLIAYSRSINNDISKSPSDPDTTSFLKHFKPLDPYIPAFSNIIRSSLVT